MLQHRKCVCRLCEVWKVREKKLRNARIKECAKDPNEIMMALSVKGPYNNVSARCRIVGSFLYIYVYICCNIWTVYIHTPSNTLDDVYISYIGRNIGALRLQLYILYCYIAPNEAYSLLCFFSRFSYIYMYSSSFIYIFFLSFSLGDY